MYYKNFNNIACDPNLLHNRHLFSNTFEMKHHKSYLTITHNLTTRKHKATVKRSNMSKQTKMYKDMNEPSRAYLYFKLPYVYRKRI